MTCGLVVHFDKVCLFEKEVIAFIISLISLFVSVIPVVISCLWRVLSLGLKAVFLSIFTALAIDSRESLFSIALANFSSCNKFCISVMNVAFATFSIDFTADSTDDKMDANIDNESKMSKYFSDSIILDN